MRDGSTSPAFWRLVVDELRRRLHQPAPVHSCCDCPADHVATNAPGLSRPARARLAQLVELEPRMSWRSRENGRQLADLFRWCSPHCDDEIAPYPLMMLDALETMHQQAPEIAAEAFAEALAYAALDLTALARLDCPDDGPLRP